MSSSSSSSFPSYVKERREQGATPRIYSYATPAKRADAEERATIAQLIAEMRIELKRMSDEMRKERKASLKENETWRKQLLQRLQPDERITKKMNYHESVENDYSIPLSSQSPLTSPSPKYERAKTRPSVMPVKKQPSLSSYSHMQYDDHDGDERKNDSRQVSDSKPSKQRVSDLLTAKELDDETEISFDEEQERNEETFAPTLPDEETFGDEEDDDEATSSRPCKLCKKRQVHGASYKHFCEKCEKKIAGEKEAYLRKSMPPLEPSRDGRPVLTPSVVTQNKTTGCHLEKTSTRLYIGSYNNDSINLPMKNEGLQDHREQEKKLASLRRTATSRQHQGMVTSEDAQEELDSCLGDVISYIIPSDERIMMRSLRQRGVTLSVRERLAVLEKSMLVRHVAPHDNVSSLSSC